MNRKVENESTGQKLAKPERAQVLSPFDEMERRFEDFFRRGWMQPFLQRGWPEMESAFGMMMPKVDVIDRDKEIVVRAELPGVTKDNLDVSMSENTLTIRASTHHEEKEEKEHYHRREMSRGEFQRSIRLPGQVEGDKAKATFKDGILELVIPKAPGAHRQNIKVE